MENKTIRREFLDDILNTLEKWMNVAETNGEQELLCVIAYAVNDNIEFVD